MQNNLDNIINQIPGYMLVLNKDLSLKNCNANYLKLAGVKNLSCLVNKKYHQFDNELIAKQSDLFVTQDQIILNENKPVRFINYCVDENEQSLIFYGEKQPLLDEHGEVSGIIGHAHDFTESYSQLFNTLFYELCKFSSARSEKLFLIENSSCDQNNITQREQEVIFYLLRGYSAKAMSSRFDISAKTIEFHIGKIKDKLKVISKQQLIEKLLELGYLFKIPDSIIG